MAKESGKRSFLDIFKVKDLDGDDEFDDDLFDDEDDDDFDDEVRKPSKSFKKSKPAVSGAEQKPAGSGYSSGTYQPSTYSSSQRQATASKPTSYTANASQNGKLVDFSAQRPKRTAPASNEVYVIKPTDLSDAQTVADFLNNGMAIVINMEGMEITLAQRIIDIVFGAVYAMGG